MLSRAHNCCPRSFHLQCSCIGVSRSHAQLPLKPLRPTVLQQAFQHHAPTDTQAYAVLKAVLPVCHADLTSPEIVGVRGLVASSSLKEGQTALLVPDKYALSVSTGGAQSVAHWQESFLGPWQAAHGRLPTSLTSFLADTRYDATVRISAWLLYLQQYSGSAPFWKSWISLLPPPAEATSASGFWTSAELQQLQLEPYKGVMSAVNAVHADVCSQAYRHLTSGDLAKLHLATSAADVMWGTFVVRTRASSHGDRVTLRPVHDLLNHAQSPNATCNLTDQGYAVEALSNIPAGAEITISYTGEGHAGDMASALDPPPEPATPSLELLMTWGFTLGVGPQDQIFPLQYQALPGLEWDLVLSATAAAMEQASGGQGWARELSTAATHNQAAFAAANSQGPHQIKPAAITQGPQQTELLVLLQAAVANLPIAENGGQAGRTASTLYNRAADIVDNYGMTGSSCCEAPAAYSTPIPGKSRLQLLGLGAGAAVAAASGLMPPPLTVSVTSSPQGQADDPIDPESAVTRLPEWAVFARTYFTQLHLQQLQADLMSEVNSQLSVPSRLRLAAAAVAAALLPPAAAAALPAAHTPGMQGSTFSSSTRWGKRELPVQLLVATALLCEVQFMLLSCGSSVLQDVAILELLQEGHVSGRIPLTPQCSKECAAYAAAAPVPPQGPAPAYSNGNSTVSTSGSTVAASNIPHAGAAADASALRHHVVTGGESQSLFLARLGGQQAVRSFQSRQRDVLQHLMLLQAQALEQHNLSLNPPVMQPQLVGSIYNQGLLQKQTGHESTGRDRTSTVAPAASRCSTTGASAGLNASVGALQQGTGLSATEEICGSQLRDELTPFKLQVAPTPLPAHLKVLHALRKGPPPVTATAAATAAVGITLMSGGSTGARYVAHVLSQQQQQLDSWKVATQQQDEEMYRAGGNPDAVAVAEVARVLSTGQASEARLKAAVAVRLQHKKLLQACAVILQEVQRQALLRHDQVP